MTSFIPKPDPASLQRSLPSVSNDSQQAEENVSGSILKRLDRLESCTFGDDEPDQHSSGQMRWMIPYVDLLTLLFGLFIALFSLTRSDKNLWEHYAVKLEHSVIQAVQTKAKVETKLHQTKTRIHQAEQQEQQLADSLSKAFSQSPSLSGALSIHPESRGLVISVTDHILFAPGRAELTTESKRQLDVIAKAIQSVGRPIRIEGHTDTSPIQTSQYPSNWELSTARATHIIQYLVQAHHFSPEQLSAAGYGEFHPVADNSSDKGKQKNRRVDIVLLAPSSAVQEP